MLGIPSLPNDDPGSRGAYRRPIHWISQMDVDGANPLAAYGFLTVLEDSQHGLFGGYLVLTHQGRPLEFHCSTPVLPTRAQKILYGPSLRPYVLGDLIGQSLLDKAQQPVLAILTDMREILALEHPGLVACVAGPSPQTSSAGATDDLNCRSNEGREPADDAEVTLAGYRLIGNSSAGCAGNSLCETLMPLVENVDLAEPFERIREAIREAQRISSQQPDEDYGPSAAA